MKRCTWAMVTVGGLWAQGWEAPGVLVTQERLKVEGPGPARTSTFLVRRALGKPEARLALPRELDARSWFRLTHGAGGSFVLAKPNHPAHGLFLHGSGTRRPLVPAERMTQILYRSTDFRTWERYATYGQDPHGKATGFYPLADGTFLATGGLFWVGQAISPFAVYRRDEQGRMKLIRLVDLGLGGPVYRAVPDGKGGWKPEAQKGMEPWGGFWRPLLATSGGYFGLNRFGRYVFFSGKDALPGPKGALPLEADRTLMGLRTLVRPDGKVLVVGSLRRRTALDPILQLEAGKLPENASMRGMVLLYMKQSTFPFYGVPEERPFWDVIDPATGRWNPVALPAGLPARAERDLWLLRLSMNPDGNLSWSFDR